MEEGTKRHSLTLKELFTQSHGEARWWQHHVMGLFLSGDWAKIKRIMDSSNTNIFSQDKFNKGMASGTERIQKPLSMQSRVCKEVWDSYWRARCPKKLKSLINDSPDICYLLTGRHQTGRHQCFTCNITPDSISKGCNKYQVNNKTHPSTLLSGKNNKLLPQTTADHRYSTA